MDEAPSLETYIINAQKWHDAIVNHKNKVWAESLEKALRDIERALQDPWIEQDEMETLQGYIAPMIVEGSKLKINSAVERFGKLKDRHPLEITLQEISDTVLQYGHLIPPEEIQTLNNLIEAAWGKET